MYGEIFLQGLSKILHIRIPSLKFCAQVVKYFLELINKLALLIIINFTIYTDCYNIMKQ